MAKIILVSRCAWTLYNFRSGLIRHLADKEKQQVIGAGAGGDGYEGKVEALGIPFVPLPVDKRGVNPRSDLKLLWALIQFYRRERPDSVHHFTIKPVIYGSLAAKLCGVPRIVNTVTGLGYVFTGNRSSLLLRVVRLQYRCALACAHTVFFQNKEDLAAFVTQRLVRADKARLLAGSGVDTGHFAPNRSPASPEQSEKLVFLMPARLLRDKGIYEFVEAARAVKAEYPDTRFQLMGTRDERNPTVVSATQLADWQASGVIEYLGHVDDVRLPLSEADVVVLPSYREGLPRSLLEAAAMAKPLITTDTVGCHDVVMDGVNGLLVPIQDHISLALAMRRMIENPVMRREMGAAGREKVVHEFNEASVIEAVVQAYA